MTRLWSQLFDDPDGAALPARAWAALLILSLAALLPGFFNIPSMDRDESRYAQASRQMIETGDYIDIKFQEQDRHVKPVGIYWMQVVTVAPFGGADAPIWAHRLPSLFGMLFAVAATAWLGARLAGAQVGFAAALLLALTLTAAIEARTAKTDAVLLATAAAAQAALYFILRRGETVTQFKGAPFAFWAASGLALIVKGPIIAMVSATTLVAFTAWTRDFSWVKRIRILPGLAVLAAITLPWYIAITLQTNGAFFMEAVGHALFGKVATGDDSHGGSPGYHTVLFLVTFWPGAILAALITAYAWAKRKDADVQFLLSWILPTWVIFELVATKLPHYVSPVFPAIALLAAFAIRDSAHMLQNGRVRIAHWVAIGLAGLVSLAISALPIIAERELGEAVSSEAIAALVFGVIATGAIIYLALKPAFPRLLAVAAGAILFYVAAFQIAIPSIDRLWLTDRLADKVATLSGCDEIPVATAGYREPSNVFAFGTKTRLEDGAGAAAHLLQNGECGLALVAQTDREAFLGALAGEEIKSFGTVTGTNYVKGRELTMELFALEASALSQ